MDLSQRVSIQAQSVSAPLTKNAIFLTLKVGDSAAAVSTVREVLSGVDGFIRTVGFRDLSARLSCVVGIGSTFWDRLGLTPRPTQLREFAEIVGPKHTAVATGGDLLFHIRAEREDLCFELEKIILEKLGDSVSVLDEVSGFRYFDARDLLGFVDGTENPTGPSMITTTVIDGEDNKFSGGSYVVVQKYLHDLSAWQGLTVEDQERVIGRRKLDNVELDDPDPQKPSHKTLATIADPDGTEHKILRDNMPFGSVGAGEFGTYFIGYAAQLWVIEEMLKRMFQGADGTHYDSILDYSRAVTGATFFMPTVEFLQNLDPDA